MEKFHKSPRLSNLALENKPTLACSRSVHVQSIQSSDRSSFVENTGKSAQSLLCISFSKLHTNPFKRLESLPNRTSPSWGRRKIYAVEIASFFD